MDYLFERKLGWGVVEVNKNQFTNSCLHLETCSTVEAGALAHTPAKLLYLKYRADFMLCPLLLVDDKLCDKERTKLRD